jgi:hypothetical protein
LQPQDPRAPASREPIPSHSATPPPAPQERSIPRRSAFAIGVLGALAGCGGSADPDVPTVPPSTGPSALVESASAPFGDALCGAASRDGALYVAGEGAALTVLDGRSLSAAGGPPLVLGRAPITPAPQSLLCDPPYVFVAGGTAGLWRVTIDGGADVDGAWPEEARILESTGALCLDVASLDEHPAGPLVAAVMSARVGFGASEVVVVDRDPPHALRSRVSLVPSSGAPGAKAFALVGDPIDSNRAYVAMGSAGVWRVDFADLEHPQVVRGPRFDRSEEFLGGEPAAAVDIDCVRAGERAILFAAIERGGLAQVDVSRSMPFTIYTPTTRPLLQCIDGGGPGRVPFGFRVSALGRADGKFLVALATNDESAESLQNGPYSCFGRWVFDLTLPGPPDLPAGCTPHTFLLRGEVPASAGADVEVAHTIGAVGGARKARSIHMVPRDDGVLVFEDRFDGASAFPLPAASWTEQFVPFPPRPPAYAGVGLGFVDGRSSGIEPGLLYFGIDGISAKHAGLPRFDTESERIETVSGTTGLCPDPGVQYCNSPESIVIPPTPWSNGIAGGACWTDASDPGREWFASGKTRITRQCPTDPCTWTEDWCSDPWFEEGNPPDGDERPPGWEIVSFASAGAVAGAAAMDLRFWSIASPPDEAGRTGRNYLGSAEGALRDDGTRLLHLFRGSVPDGYLVCSATDVVQRALGSCTPATRGRGQRIEPAWLHVLRTHFEIGPTDSAEAALTWRGEEFSLDVGGSRRNFIAVAAGWIVPVAGAPWSQHANRGSIVVYDITHVDAGQPPVLARILLAPRGVQANLVAVRAAVLGERTWLFAGDLGGGAHAFDVSADMLVDGAPADPTDPETAVEPANSWYVQPDAYDGQRANVTDLELDVDTDPAHPVVLLGNARRGITILDIERTPGARPSVELREADYSPIDTPGIVSGLVPFRRDGVTWVAVGDARCGIRLYRRGN